MNAELPHTHPKLSILVPAYNIEKYIGPCIDSLLSQNYPNVEIIVVDDGSTDSTNAILRQYAEKKQIFLIEKENGGLCSARNKAMQYITGEFFVFMDGDDVIAPNSYDDNLKFMISDPELDVVQFPVMFGWTSTNERVNKAKPTTIISKKTMFEQYLIQNLTFSICNKICRTSAIKSLSFVEGLIYEDVDASYKLIELAGKVKISDQGMYYYRRTPNSIITSPMHFKKMKDYFFVTFLFLRKAHEANASALTINYYLSRWLRLNDFLLFSDLESDQKEQLIKLTQEIHISKFKLIIQLVAAKLSFKKFKTLWYLSSKELDKAIVLANS